MRVASELRPRHAAVGRPCDVCGEEQRMRPPQLVHASIGSRESGWYHVCEACLRWATVFE